VTGANEVEAWEGEEVAKVLKGSVGVILQPSLAVLLERRSAEVSPLAMEVRRDLSPEAGVGAKKRSDERASVRTRREDWRVKTGRSTGWRRSGRDRRPRRGGKSRSLPLRES